MYSVKNIINGMICVTLINFIGSLAHAGEGVWRDPATGLTWMRCPIGEKWTGKTCARIKLMFFNWEEALDFAAAFNRDGGFAGHTDWRVPTIEELVTIRKCNRGGWRHKEIGYKATVEGKVPVMGDMITVQLPGGGFVPKICKDYDYDVPTLNTAIFPNTERSNYWSSSLSVGNDGYAWTVDFLTGDTTDSFTAPRGLIREGNNPNYVSSVHYVRLVRFSQ